MRETRQWTALLAVLLLMTLVGDGASAQYAQGLPQGIVAAEVEDQPVDSVNSPVVETTTPRIGGRVDTGLPTVDIGIGGMEITRFSAVVDVRGRFRATPPTPLTPGQYALYFYDALIGYFTVSDTAQATADGENGRPPLDIARIVPFPADFGDVIPNLGLLEGRFYSVENEARRTAAANGDSSREAVQQIQDGLVANGWQQRYEVRMAAPSPEDPARFDVQVTSFVIEYADPAQAQAAFAASASGGDIAPDVIVGNESELVLLNGTTPDTNAPYQALRLLYRQDRLIGMIILADLLNRTPDQTLIVNVAYEVSARAASVLDGTVSGEATRALRLDLPASASTNIDEAYDVVDGQIVPLYNEDDAMRAARLASFEGTFEDYSASFVGTVGGLEGSDTASATAADDQPFAFATMLSAFPAPEDADAWLAGLADRLSTDPLRGYLSFAAVESAPLFGENSATYQFQRQTGEQTTGGFRVYARIGGEIATVEYSTAADASLDEVAELVNAQLTCLQDGFCKKAASIPGRSQRSDAEQPGDGTQAGNADATGTPPASETDGASGGVQDVPPGNSTSAAPNGNMDTAAAREERQRNRENRQNEPSLPSPAGSEAPSDSPGGSQDVGTGQPSDQTTVSDETDIPENADQSTGGGVQDVTPAPPAN